MTELILLGMIWICLTLGFAKYIIPIFIIALIAILILAIF